MSGKIDKPDKIVASVPPISILHYAYKVRNITAAKVIIDIQDAWPQAFYQFIPAGNYLGPILFYPILQYLTRSFRRANGITSVAKGYIALAKVDTVDVPCLVAPIGIPLSMFDAHYNRKPIISRPFTFIYIGSMSSNYDLVTILYAASLLRKKNYSFRIIFAGAGHQEHVLRESAKELRIQDVVEFKGFLHRQGLLNALAESDVALNCIYPKSYILLPNKIGDYVGAALPIINSLSGELEIMLERYSAGIQYRAGDNSSLAKAMEYYLINRDVVIRHGRNARRLAEIYFNRDINYQLFAKFVETN